MIAALQHRPGDHIQERYEVRRVLGAGAFGTVYLCLDLELDVQVAVKELHVLNDPETAGNEREAALRQFRLEATHLSHLRHPNIVSGHYQPHAGAWQVCPICGLAFDSGLCLEHRAPLLELAQRHYLVMEYVDGPHLGEAARLSGGALPLDRALRYIGQIAGALALIHERGWIHRDVKPENVRLRTRGDSAVLLDFGIAGESGAHVAYSTQPLKHTQGGGTAGYAPDNPAERRLPDARSDVHALGMTLLHLLSGREPTEPEDLAYLRAHKPSYFNRTIPPALDALILRAINADPARRPPDGATFLADLEALSQPKTAQTTPAVPAPPPIFRSESALIFRSGTRAHDIEDWVRLADEYPREAREMLFSGLLAGWFEQRGWADYAAQAQRIRVEFAGRPAQGLEALLQSTGMVVAPKLSVEPQELEFGALSPGQNSTIHLRVVNGGRGHLFGNLRASHLALELPGEFDGNSLQIPITFYARPDLRLRGNQDGEIIIDSSAGELRLPFFARVRTRRSLAPFATVLLWALLGMMSGEVMRAWPLAFRSKSGAWGWLDAHDGLPWLPAAPAFGFAVWLILLGVTLGEAQRRRGCKVLIGGAALAALSGVVVAIFGNVLLVTGDEILRPLFSPLTHDFAAGGWMFAGGIAGAAYGTFRRWRDVFTTRSLQVCAGWLVALCIAYGVLAAALEAH